ncbi:MAG: multidrug resistance protein D [Candidatus Xenolissoclinum pacificiensis L6]|uniref:Multidrug resistance protein D n=1 Tax=Candidatus Xenolissoclinum pacificiensis L6 TaxID=1401685 RepID=W2V0I6_9RICK|nr:MAG: multidrug resistance protein D [Candidatus Xenolissoclinum pacificiensis L6]
MESVIRTCMVKDRATLLALFIILFIGVSVYTAIPLEQNPDVEIPTLSVYVGLYGISPEDSARLLVKPLTNKFRSVEGLKKIKASAVENGAYIVLEFVSGYDIPTASNDVRAKVDESMSELPEDVDRPIVQEINVSLFPILNISLSGLDERSLINIASDLQDLIENSPNVLEAKISGERENSLEIIIDPKILYTYSLNIEDLKNSIIQNNLLITAGNFLDKGYTVKIPGNIITISDIEKIPIRSSSHEVLTFGDIATIKRSYKDATSIAKINNDRSMVIEVSKRSGKNMIDTIEEVREIVDEYRKNALPTLKVDYFFDQSQVVKDTLLDLENNILFAILLVMMILMKFINIRSASLVAISIPGSFLFGLITVYLLGYTLNIVVLFSLIMAVGMLVDASIVVIEAADRFMISGLSARESYLRASLFAYKPIISSTLTTLAVFMPLLFWPGVAGEFMKYLPITLIATLSGSLLMSLIFAPTIGAIIGKPSTTDPKKIIQSKAIIEGNVNELNNFYNGYKCLLEKILKRPKLFVVSIFGLLFLCIFLYSILGKGVEFFPKVEPDVAVVTVRSQGNYSLYQKDEMISRLSQLILDNDVGKNELQVVYHRSGGHVDLSNFTDDIIGNIQIEFANWKTRRKATTILSEIRQILSQEKGVVVEVQEESGGPSSGKPIQLVLFADSPENFHHVVDVSSSVVEYMSTLEGLINVSDSRSTPEIQWSVEVDKPLASIYDVKLSDISNHIQLLTSGLIISQFNPDYSKEEVDIVLRYPEKERLMKAFNTLQVNTNQGQVSIDKFVTIKPDFKVKQVNEFDTKQIIIITADIAPGYLTNNKILEIKDWIYNNDEWSNLVSFYFAGESEDQEEAQSFLSGAFLSAIMLVIFILVSQFNSFLQTIIIISSIFLSVTGVMLGLLITDQAFGIVMCGVGNIILSGTVVNSNILLIEQYNSFIQNQKSVVEAAILASITRLKAILLTSMTTVLGLTPMAIGLNIDFVNFEITYGAPSTQYWKQLATTVAGGLTFCTILTLFLTPSLLVIFFDRKRNNRVVDNKKA